MSLKLKKLLKRVLFWWLICKSNLWFRSRNFLERLLSCFGGVVNFLDPRVACLVKQNKLIYGRKLLHWNIIICSKTIKRRRLNTKELFRQLRTGFLGSFIVSALAVAARCVSHSGLSMIFSKANPWAVEISSQVLCFCPALIAAAASLNFWAYSLSKAAFLESHSSTLSEPKTKFLIFECQKKKSNFGKKLLQIMKFDTILMVLSTFFFNCIRKVETALRRQELPRLRSWSWRFFFNFDGKRSLFNVCTKSESRYFSNFWCMEMVKKLWIWFRCTTNFVKLVLILFGFNVLFSAVSILNLN